MWLRDGGRCGSQKSSMKTKVSHLVHRLWGLVLRDGYGDGRKRWFMSFLSVKATAVILGVSEMTVRRWCKEGKLQSFRPGGRCNFRIPTWGISNLILKRSPEQQHDLTQTKS